MKLKRNFSYELTSLVALGHALHISFYSETCAMRKGQDDVVCALTIHSGKVEITISFVGFFLIIL